MKLGVPTYQIYNDFNEMTIHDPGALLHKLYFCDIINVLRSRRLRWFDHVERAPSASCIKMSSKMKISSIKRHGRPRKTWLDCVKNDIKERCLPTLTRKTVFYGELQFDNVWCCKPHLMRQGQHHNQKSDMMMMITYSILRTKLFRGSQE